MVLETLMLHTLHIFISYWNIFHWGWADAWAISLVFMGYGWSQWAYLSSSIMIISISVKYYHWLYYYYIMCRVFDVQGRLCCHFTPPTSCGQGTKHSHTHAHRRCWDICQQLRIGHLMHTERFTSSRTDTHNFIILCTYLLCDIIFIMNTYT